MENNTMLLCIVWLALFAHLASLPINKVDNKGTTCANSKMCGLNTEDDEDSLNDRPIIGIIGQLIHKQLPIVNGSSYILANYVKHLESGGARVVPIPTNFSDEQITSIFKKINGVVFPGGNQLFRHSTYYRHAKLLFDLAIKANDAGSYFPVWGTCLGLQTLCMLVADTDEIISDIDALGFTWPLNLTEAAYNTPMFGDMCPKLKKAMVTQNLTMNAHKNCVRHEEFRDNEKLSNFFEVLSTNTDSSGRTFASTIQGKEYPFYGVQWHPEMPQFEFVKDPSHGIGDDGIGGAIPHTPTAIRMSQHFANFFVNEARRSPHRFASWNEEEEYMIYKYPIYHGGLYGIFAEQTYIFP